MTLTGFALTIRKYSWVIVVMVVITILLSLVLIKFNTSQNPHNQVVSLPSIQPPAFNNIPFTVSDFDVSLVKTEKNHPKQLSVFEKVPGKDFLQPEYLNEIKKTFQIDGDTQEVNDVNLGKGLTITSMNGILQVFTDFIFYQKINLHPVSQALPLPPKEDLISKSQNFFSAAPFNFSAPRDVKITFSHFTPHDSYEDENPQDAPLVRLKLIPLLENYELITTQKEITVSYNKAVDTMSVSFTDFEQSKKTTTYPIIDARTAANLLKQNGHLIQVSGQGQLYLGTKTPLETIVIKSFYPAYYFGDRNQKLVQPIWIFEGDSKIQNLPLKVTYAVPAVDPKYFQNPSSP